LSKKILVSGLWAYVENGSAQVFSIITFLFIAKVVGPEEFGTVAIAAAWAALFGSLSEAGISDAVIQKVDRTKGFVSTAFWLNLGLALVGTLLVLAFGLTVKVSDNPKVSQYIAALAVGIPITALGNIPTSLLRAELRNKDLARRGIASDVAGCVAGIGCAMAGLGGWAIIVQTLLSTATKTAVVWRCSHWMPERTFEKEASLEILRYGYKSLGTGLLSSISARVDRFILGFFFGAKEVGIYAIASEGITRVSAVLITGLSQVMFPHYASLQKQKEALADAFFRSISWSCFVGAGAFAMLHTFAPWIASGVLGQKWADSAPILRILCLLGLMQCITVVAMTLYKSVGRPGLGLAHAASQVALNIALVFLLKDRGLEAIAIALAVRPLCFLAVHAFTTNLILENSKVRFFKSIAPGLLLYACAVGLSVGVTGLAHSTVWAAVAALVLVMGAIVVRVRGEWLASRS